MSERSATVLALVLAASLAASGVLNLVPGAHPENTGRPVAFLEARADWFQRSPTDDLAPLAEKMPTFSRVSAPYLWLGRHLEGAPLVTYPGSLKKGRARRTIERQPEGQPPVRFLDPWRVRGFLRTTVHVCDYAPRLPEGAADLLLGEAGKIGDWETGHRYAVVTRAERNPARARVMVHGEVLFFVADAVLEELGVLPEERC